MSSVNKAELMQECVSRELQVGFLSQQLESNEIIKKPLAALKV
jgi:hypothetical protein